LSKRQIDRGNKEKVSCADRRTKLTKNKSKSKTTEHMSMTGSPHSAGAGEQMATPASGIGSSGRGSPVHGA